RAYPPLPGGTGAADDAALGRRHGEGYVIAGAAVVMKRHGHAVANHRGAVRETHKSAGDRVGSIVGDDFKRVAGLRHINAGKAESHKARPQVDCSSDIELTVAAAGAATGDLDCQRAAG